MRTPTSGSETIHSNGKLVKIQTVLDDLARFARHTNVRLSGSRMEFGRPRSARGTYSVYESWQRDLEPV